MRVLGVDPGTETTGYGVLDAAPAGRLPTLVTFGEIRSATRRRPLPERLRVMYTGVAALIARVRPEVIVVEKRGILLSPLRREGHRPCSSQRRQTRDCCDHAIFS